MTDNKQLKVYDECGDYIKTSIDEVIANTLNNWNGWSCSAGMRYLYVDYDRNIFICNTASANALKNRWGEDWEQYVRDEKIRLGDWDPPEEVLEQMVARWRIKITKSDFSNDVGFIGKIGEDIDFPIFDMVKCPFELCACGADILASKSKSQFTLGITNKESETLDLKTITPIMVEPNFPMAYHILWDLTRRCNYSCPYCWKYAHNKTDKFIPTDDVLNACEQFVYGWAGGEKINFHFGGGEPTIHPGFMDIIKYLNENGQWILVTSNASMPKEFWKEAVNYINNFNFSVHLESVNKERFIENLKVVSVGYHGVEVKIMTPPGKMEEAMKFQKAIHIDCPSSLVPIRGLYDSTTMVEYSSEELEYFKNQ